MAGRVLALSPLREFLRTEAGGGVLLLAATVAALAWANSPWADNYQELWHTSLSIGPGSWAVREHLQHWVNDALMVVFFFLIGLDIKRELVVGELRDPRAPWSSYLVVPIFATAVAWGATRAGAGRLPPGVGMNHVLGSSALGGIGFAVSLFITGLAFTSNALQVQAKIGILAGSVIAALVGVAILLRQAEPAEAQTVSTGGPVAT